MCRSAVLSRRVNVPRILSPFTTSTISPRGSSGHKMLRKSSKIVPSGAPFLSFRLLKESPEHLRHPDSRSFVGVDQRLRRVLGPQRGAASLFLKHALCIANCICYRLCLRGLGVVRGDLRPT